MAWRITELSQVPLGRRILRIGSKGDDVRELQQLLMEGGFYFGPVDGIYGILTEEGVSLFQKTFNLRNDGIAGLELFTALKNASLKLNRIIYTVKPRENLKTISRNFGVAKSAWQGIPGQGNPQRKIYPGMKILLNQKAVFWSGKGPSGFPGAAHLEVGWELVADGGLVRVNNAEGGETYQTVVAQPETWGKILSSHNYWEKIGASFKRISEKHWGIDFRDAPLETVFRWRDLVQYICKIISKKQIPLILVPMSDVRKTVKNRLYWLNLPLISNFAKLVLLEPLICLDSPLAYLQSTSNLEKNLNKLIRLNLGPKVLLMGRVGGWDWNIDQDCQCRPVSFREGRILAAMNHRSVKYNPDTTYTVIDYIRCRERHCLIFRDQQGWLDWIRIGLKSNLLGFAIHDPKDLGNFGGELISGSFCILSEDKLMK